MTAEMGVLIIEERKMTCVKLSGVLAFASLSVLLLDACATGGQVRMVQRSEKDSARLMAANDNVIVPGERVGAVFLGMTEGQLYTKMGNPVQTFPQARGASTLYVYPDLKIDVQNATHRVSVITVTGSSYRTTQGVSAGTPELEMKAKLGQPVWEILAMNCSNGNACPGDMGTEVKLCYNSGVTAYANGGHITRMEIWTGVCGG